MRALLNTYLLITLYLLHFVLFEMALSHLKRPACIFEVAMFIFETANARSYGILTIVLFETALFTFERLCYI